MRIKESKPVIKEAADLAVMHTSKELHKIERAAKLARRLRKLWKKNK